MKSLFYEPTLRLSSELSLRRQLTENLKIVRIRLSRAARIVDRYRDARAGGKRKTHGHAMVVVGIDRGIRELSVSGLATTM